MTVAIATLLLRLAAGLIVAAHGAQKLFCAFGGNGLQKMHEWVATQGFRPALFWAVLAGVAEFGGGLLFALGLFSPLGSIGIGSAMLIAITKAHWPRFWSTRGGFEYPLLILVIALAVGLTGPGPLSLDAIWGTSLPPGLSPFAVALAVVGYLAGMITSARRPSG